VLIQIGWDLHQDTGAPSHDPPAGYETTRIHRVAGRTGDRTALVTTRPCRTPHHTISEVGLIGGGPVPQPGDVSLAHNGVLFMDERPEFCRHVRRVLHQPIKQEASGNPLVGP
jgi:predicted ATPase with chaperone activity